MKKNQPIKISQMIDSKSGITLLALIITIAVMLILVTVTISFSLGEGGIFNTTKRAKIDTKVAEYKEKIQLARVYTAKRNHGIVTLDNLIERIYAKKIIPEGNIKKRLSEKSAKAITKEGYVLVITTELTEYIGLLNETGGLEDELNKEDTMLAYVADVGDYVAYAPTSGRSYIR